MKNCVWCGQEIADLARKCNHCQSFQNPNDAPKPGFELATLVISFVGVMAGIATLAAGIFGYFGFKSIHDLDMRATQIHDKANTLLESTDKKLTTFDQEIRKKAESDRNLTERLAKTEVDLNLLLIRQTYSRFNSLMDDLRLDELHRVSDVLDQLRELRTSISVIEPVPEPAKWIVSDVSVIVETIFLYKDELYQEVVERLSPVSDRSLHKHRIAGGAYSHLYKKAVAQKKGDDAAGFLAKHKYHAKIYHDSALRANKSNLIAKINYAAALIEGGESGELERAMDLLIQARKEAPQISTIYYNLAAVFVKQNKLEDALTNLEEARHRGDFSTEEDVRFFKNDPSFASLRKSDIPQIQERLKKLLTIS